MVVAKPEKKDITVLLNRRQEDEIQMEFVEVTHRLIQRAQATYKMSSRHSAQNRHSISIAHCRQIGYLHATRQRLMQGWLKWVFKRYSCTHLLLSRFCHLYYLKIHSDNNTQHPLCLRPNDTPQCLAHSTLFFPRLRKEKASSRPETSVPVPPSFTTRR